MKTNVLSIPLLLVVTLAVPWVGAAPLEAALEDKDLDSLQEFLKLNPSIAEQLFPKLVNSADYVSLTIDPAVVADLLADYAEDNGAQGTVGRLEGEEGVESEEEKEHARQKRIFFLSVSRGDTTSNSNNFLGPKMTGDASGQFANQLGNVSGGAHSIGMNFGR